ncbi:methionine aminopeptidase, type I [Hahella chejuensis KCTC 2396]|uniref:Methionine aminopeptidase n=1 Tax=Hahella chejuensis (strain KCTC 2396) TaxID=349521 RepID=Q2SGH4_HAHCH|nr:type I methionyl aminopeptidase [Hahella chejuensis]ABC30250.1 methionine aminopeptidase, type I [Hahella chejuensis KCTC 2396]
MTIETEQDLLHLKHIGGIVATILQEMITRTEPGMTTGELDQIGKGLFEKYEAESAPLVSYNFPGYTCISVNEEAAHGIPGGRVIRPGDIVNIDVSGEKNGYFADTGGTFIVPPSTPQKDRLLHATKLALRNAAAKARAGENLNVIGKEIQKVAKDKGFKIIRNLCSHGVGRSLHEEPKEILGYYDPREERRLHKGLVITIEPFLSTKSKHVTEASDGWTLVGAAGNLSAQFEHTMVITNGQPILVTVPQTA